MRTVLLAICTVVLIISGCAPASKVNTQPYAAIQDRAIKALDPIRVEELLAGKGAGYALAAELNNFPGPTHVLALKAPLKLSAEQERRTQQIYDEMQAKAKTLGRALVDLEAKLDESFRTAQATSVDVSSLTAQIGSVEGGLRAAHLDAHLLMKQILSPEQIRIYNEHRGYTGAGKPGGHSGSHK